MSLITVIETVRRRQLHWRAAEFVLFMMMLGPLIAPYFSRIDGLAFKPTADFVYWIGRVICPQLEHTFLYGGLPFAVCFRCTAALIGLVVSRWFHRPGGIMHNWSMKARLGFLGLNLIWLTIDIQYARMGIWEINTPLVVLHGLIYGVSVGGVVFAGLLALDRWLESFAVQPSSPSPFSRRAKGSSRVLQSLSLRERDLG